MNLIDVVRDHKKYNQSNSVQWFIANVTQLAKQTNLGPQAVLGLNQHYQTGVIRPGGMFFFMYDPKHKDTLPYYDTFPLVLPFNQTGEHFWGLNIHYLPYGARLGLLNSLMTLPKASAGNQRDRLILNWQLLNNAARFPAVSVCVKQYLKSHVKSRFVEVPMNAWAVAAMLPVQRFKNAPHTDVWKQSRNAMKRKY